ncbi:hypothetical protein CFBP4996_19635 [Agrobacterium leguminum]|uniref:hypothetical protein n=1 Tax=Agrobacterium TaxID=357 RepID=UPI0013C4BEBF|nr:MULTISPECIES: hypothetical protein [Agrobacterium]WFS68229.1 hypothetical protein CFBP4996_19635 [Agrobacterium leguminum]
MTQLDFFKADPKNYPPNVIDIMPAVIRKIAAEPVWPPTPKAGEIVQLKRSVA